MERADSSPNPADYTGSRAEWVLKKTTDLDDKARSLHCGHCGQQAIWVCLDPVCVYYNRDRVVSLCDDCDKRFHPASSFVMNSHRRLGVVLYMSMLMLHRYHKVVGAIVGSIDQSRHSIPGSTDKSATISTQLPVTSIPAQWSPSVATSPLETSANSDPASPDSTETSRKRKHVVDDTTKPTTKVSRTNDGRSDQFSIAEVRPIHESYGRILGRIRENSALSVSEGCMHEPFGKLTVRNYAAIAELKIVDPKLYTSVLDSYMRRGDGSGTLSGFERECRQVLSGFVQQVAVMRARKELLPCFDVHH